MSPTVRRDADVSPITAPVTAGTSAFAPAAELAAPTFTLPPTAAAMQQSVAADAAVPAVPAAPPVPPGVALPSKAPPVVRRIRMLQNKTMSVAGQVVVFSKGRELTADDVTTSNWADLLGWIGTITEAVDVA